MNLENMTDLINLFDTINQANQATNTNLSDSLTIINELEVGDLPEIATALADILASAQGLQAIDWNVIAEGISGLHTSQEQTQTPTATSPGPRIISI